jgi:hypothetical protein
MSRWLWFVPQLAIIGLALWIEHDVAKEAGRAPLIGAALLGGFVFAYILTATVFYGQMIGGQLFRFLRSRRTVSLPAHIAEPQGQNSGTGAPRPLPGQSSQNPPRIGIG